MFLIEQRFFIAEISKCYDIDCSTSLSIYCFDTDLYGPTVHSFKLRLLFHSETFSLTLHDDIPHTFKSVNQATVLSVKVSSACIQRNEREIRTEKNCRQTTKSGQ